MKPKKLAIDYVIFDKKTNKLIECYNTEKEALEHYNKEITTLYKITTYKY